MLITELYARLRQQSDTFTNHSYSHPLKFSAILYMVIRVIAGQMRTVLATQVNKRT